MQSKQIEELLVSEDALQNKLSEVETLLKAKQEEIEMKSGYLGYNELLDKNLELENQLQAVMADKEAMQDQYNRNTDIAIENLQVELEFYKTDNKTLKEKFEVSKNELSGHRLRLEIEQKTFQIKKLRSTVSH